MKMPKITAMLVSVFFSGMTTGLTIAIVIYIWTG